MTVCAGESIVVPPRTFIRWLTPAAGFAMRRDVDLYPFPFEFGFKKRQEETYLGQPRQKNRARRRLSSHPQFSWKIKTFGRFWFVVLWKPEFMVEENLSLTSVDGGRVEFMVMSLLWVLVKWIFNIAWRLFLGSCWFISCQFISCLRLTS